MPIPGQEFSGGQEFKGPWGVVRSGNLTPHATGLGDRDEAAFVGLFKAFAMPVADLPQVPLEQNTIMPWLTRGRMTEAGPGRHLHLSEDPPANRAHRREASPPQDPRPPPSATTTPTPGTPGAP